MRHRRLSAFLVCVWLFIAAGCVIPLIDRVDPLYPVPVLDPQTGTEIQRPKLTTILLDAETKREINDAQVVLVLHRNSASIPDSARGSPEERPKVAVDKFARLEKLSYTDTALYIYPFFAIGTEYAGVDIFVYKRGYRPVAFKQIAPGKYPDVIEMTSCEADKSNAMMIELAAGRIFREEWRHDVREMLDKHLE